MSRKRLGRITPEAASRARDAAEKALAEQSAASRAGPPIARMAAGVGQEIDAEIRRLKSELDAQSTRTAALEKAEAEGRVIVAVDLDQIDLEHLTRDRVTLNRGGEDWIALKDSIRARGQQTPVELSDLGEGASPRYGLISGLRRIRVLRELLEETGDERYALVLALIRPAQATPDKLIAMIEENEIRRGISFYERGRIAGIAAQQGIFEDIDTAVDALFPRSDRNRRYKIRCFASIFEHLDHRLDHPQAIGERLGLEMAKLIREGGALALAVTLDGLAKDRDAAGEVEALTRTVNGDPPYRKKPEDRHAALKPRPGSDMVTAKWQGGDGMKIRARARHGGERVTVQIEGLSEVSTATLERLVSLLGNEVERQGG